MAKPKTPFTEAFERILTSAWGLYQDRLDGSRLRQTREAASHIRSVYRFKGERLGVEAPSKLDFRKPRNRAGYLAAFGERHAYLSYKHLQMVREKAPEAVPKLDDDGELTVTLVGAGPAIETYGLCLFYNEKAHTLKRLTVNLIERVREWQPTRDLVKQLLKDVWPKLDVFHEDIVCDLKEENCVQTFASHHDSLVRTQILFIYNVLNEIEAEFAHVVLRNLGYIMKQCERSLLVLVAEPSAAKAWPRIKWLRDALLSYEVVLDERDAIVEFSQEPTIIAFEGDEMGLNDRLFSGSSGKNMPVLETKLPRVLFACRMTPLPSFSAEHLEQLRRRLQLRRDKKGRIRQQKPATDYQPPLF